MTDTEILDWLERLQPDVCEPAVGDPEWLIEHPLSGRYYYAPTLREAVEKAARESSNE